MKKFVSLWIIFAMLTTLLPANLVKADVAADLDVAKGYIDGIVEAAPTVEKYVFTEELAEQVDGLENILRSMTNSSAIETLDSYFRQLFYICCCLPGYLHCLSGLARIMRLFICWRLFRFLRQRFWLPSGGI